MMLSPPFWWPQDRFSLLFGVFFLQVTHPLGKRALSVQPGERAPCWQQDLQPWLRSVAKRRVCFGRGRGCFPSPGTHRAGWHLWGHGARQTCFTPGRGQRGVGEHPALGLQQGPAAPRRWGHCSSHALAARDRFGDRGGRGPFLSSPGSQPSRFTDSFASAFCWVFRPEVMEDLPRGGERRRRLSLILIGVEV